MAGTEGESITGLPRVGDVVGERYLIQRVLGAGGMGVVFAATQTDLRREVAIKFLRPEVAMQPAIASRFVVEAQACARIVHDNVIAIHDFDAKGATLYLVMELLRGESLEALLAREGRIAPTAALPIVIDVLAGLDAAHGQGVVHRDIKPENVFLDTRSGRQRAKVVDFGIARLTDATMGLTRDGAHLGTPEYMSPEQARAESDIDHRTDIYSVGVMLYEVLSGARPFSAPTPLLLLAEVASKPPRPLVEVAPDLPSQLGEVVARAMARERAERFQSASEFADALRALRLEARGGAPAPKESPPVVPRPPTPATDKTLAAPTRWVVPLGIAMAALLTGLLRSYPVRRPAPPRPWRDAGGDLDASASLQDVHADSRTRRSLTALHPPMDVALAGPTLPRVDDPTRPARSDAAHVAASIAAPLGRSFHVTALCNEGGSVVFPHTGQRVACRRSLIDAPWEARASFNEPISLLCCHDPLDDRSPCIRLQWRDHAATANCIMP